VGSSIIFFLLFPIHSVETTDKWKFTFCGLCFVIYLRNKDQQDALFFLNLFQ